MICIVFVNGEYLLEIEVKIFIFDCGFLMVDVVYEVILVLGGKFVDFEGYVVCLECLFKELDMKVFCIKEELLEIYCKLVEVNEIDEGLVYL